MKYYALSYTFKVWLTSLLVAPPIYLVIDYYSYPKQSNFSLPDLGSLLQGYFGFIMVGAVLSFITWLVFWGVGVIAYRNTTNYAHRKLIMSLIGGILTVLTFLPFFLLDDSFSGFPTAIMFSYFFCIVIGGLIYRFD